MKTQFKDEDIDNAPTLDTKSLDDSSRDDTACVHPAVGSKLPDYIVNLLDDNEAFEVDQHLVDCRYCKDKYLFVLRVQREAAVRIKAATTNRENATLSNDSLEGLEVGNRPD
jgi:hypothetical protein